MRNPDLTDAQRIAVAIVTLDLAAAELRRHRAALNGGPPIQRLFTHAGLAR